MKNKEIRIMIVDDHKMIRDGIKLMLKGNPEIKVVAEGENGLDAVKYIDNNPTSVDVILMDISMPKLNGIAATKDIKGNHKNINVLAITMHLEESYITDMIKYVAQGISNAEIGAAMCLSSRTIESHRRNILQKLDLKNTAELITYAIKNKWA